MAVHMSHVCIQSHQLCTSAEVHHQCHYMSACYSGRGSVSLRLSSAGARHILPRANSKAQHHQDISLAVLMGHTHRTGEATTVSSISPTAAKEPIARARTVSQGQDVPVAV